MVATLFLATAPATLTLGAEDTEAVAEYSTGDWHTTGEWPLNSLGNVRARVSVSEKAKVVWAHVAWRRHDSQPENKDIIVVDAATGKRVANVVRAGISRECGDLLFQPVSGPGEYHIYYLPFRSTGRAWYVPTTVYLTPTNTADAAWAATCAPVVERIKAGKTAGVPQAKLIDIQATDDFHRFDPMEVTATAAETSKFMAKYGNHPYLLFPEGRRYPIRMTDEMPLRWIQSVPGEPFAGEACRGEFYCFQVGMYAYSQPVEDVSISFEKLVGTGGTVIPASAIRCFNLSGTNWLGKEIHKTVNVPKGKVQAFWVGIAVPKDISAQTFHGKLRFAAKNAPAMVIKVELKVSDTLLADAGDSEIWRFSRLRWLDSTIGLDDEVFPPYSPVALQQRTVSVLGRTVHFNDTGLPDSITSAFSRNVDAADAPAQQLLAGPIEFVAETQAGRVNWNGAGPKIVSQSSGALSWEAASTGGPLRLECDAKMECDGYVNFKLTVRATKAADLKDLRLEIPLRRELAIYMMGMGRKGGYRPASWDWKWFPGCVNNQLWIGDVNAGLSCKLKDIEDRWDLWGRASTWKDYQDWSNAGLGGCTVREEGDRVVIRAYTGARKVAKGETLHFNFGLLTTPVKVLDKGHWNWRYFQRGVVSPEEAAQNGATVINIHQGEALNPYINYPFLTVKELSAYTRDAHARNMKVKIYYTVRELTDYTGEFWALRSLGDEVFVDAPGFLSLDEAAKKKPEQELPITGDSWLCEHVITGYDPAWHTPLNGGRVDAAIYTSSLSRWHNYYLEGLNWMVKEVGIDGLYLDGIGYDRKIMKRVRKVLQRGNSGCLIDFHDCERYNPVHGDNLANYHLELFPYIDSLWFGENFDYNEPPEYWLIDIAGIPYGLFGEMLQDGGNPWRGMLFGMTCRVYQRSSPQALWKVWDDFGIQDARMSGYWDPQCPVKTGLKDVLATAYIKKGKTLVSVASWAANATDVRLKIDCAKLGLDPSKASLYAPAIPNFQPEAKFKLGDNISVPQGKGWLFILDEAGHKP